MAGGTPWGAASPEEGEYLNTSYAHHGMRGTDLPPLPTGVKWTIGATAEVSELSRMPPTIRIHSWFSTARMHA